ncbi:TPA: hypothetical protein QFT23_006069 [Bacillus cereus]|nr:hypothetical protein [Bacillus cereus]
MTKQQVKFYVSENEMERLKVLSKLRFMTVPNYTKLTALGVQIRQPKEIVLGGLELQEEDKMVLREVLERRQGNGYIAYDRGFNERLEQLAKRLLGEEK